MIQGQQEILEMIAKGQSLPDILHNMVRVVEKQFIDKWCTILLVDETGEYLRIGAAPSLPDEYNRLIDGLKIAPQAGSCGRAACLKKKVIVPDILVEPSWEEWRDIASAYQIRACSSFPIMSTTNRVLGTLAVYSRDSYSPDRDELEIIEFFAFFFGAIIERYQAEKEVERLAHYDSLTNLPNRRFFIKYSDQTLQTSEDHSQAGVLFIDLDRFKPINDTFGHEMGDHVLQMVSKRIKECLPEGMLLARMNGDEFAVLLSGIDPIEECCKHILHVLDETFYYAGHSFQISASIGISLYPDHGVKAETLIQHADIAMYQAKSNGKKGYCFYEPAMSEKIVKNFMMVSDFNKALRENEFVLYYQPRYKMNTNKIHCVEALIRWNHPNKGLIPPLDFMPLAEETGFIIPLGKWVLQEACKKNKEWQERGLPPIRVAVNCSAGQLQQDDFIQTIQEVIQQTKLDPSWLEIEITESALMISEQTNIIKLRELRNLGIHISIDDFGTGYSSLNYLMQFDVHALKIDRMFVQQIPNAVIANTIISLCRNLGLDAIAEGVETMEQYEYLRGCGCDEVQGFLFGKPVPADSIEKLLRSGAQRHGR